MTYPIARTMTDLTPTWSTVAMRVSYEVGEPDGWDWFASPAWQKRIVDARDAGRVVTVQKKLPDGGYVLLAAKVRANVQSNVAFLATPGGRQKLADAAMVASTGHAANAAAASNFGGAA